MFLKGTYMYSIAIAFLGYVAGSLVIFLVPLNVTGWKKGFIVSGLLALPLTLFIAHRDPAASVISGLIIPSILGSLIGTYSLQEEA